MSRAEMASGYSLHPKMDLYLSVIAVMSPYESEPKVEPFKQEAHVILATDI